MLVRLSQEPNALQGREEHKEFSFKAHRVELASKVKSCSLTASTVLGGVRQAPRSLASFAGSCSGKGEWTYTGSGLQVQGCTPVGHTPTHGPECTPGTLAIHARNRQSEARTPCLLWVLRPQCNLEEAAITPLASVLCTGKMGLATCTS